MQSGSDQDSKKLSRQERDPGVTFDKAMKFRCRISNCIDKVTRIHVAGLIKRTFEPRHDKTNKMSVRSAKTQISLDYHVLL